jgi:hypothetical protein
VGGGLDDGSENAPLASKLAQHFTVYNYQRRGRGGSGDTPPYAVEREVEDIAALFARSPAGARPSHDDRQQTVVATGGNAGPQRLTSSRRLSLVGRG